MLSDGFNEAARLASERVAMPKVNRETLAEFRVPLPPLSVQRAIADVLDAQTEEIDQVRTALAEQVVCIREYRQALITAAVTGQLNIEGSHGGVTHKQRLVDSGVV